MLATFFRKFRNWIQSNFFYRPRLKYASSLPNNYYQIFLQINFFYESVDESSGGIYLVRGTWDHGSMFTKSGQRTYCSSGLGAWSPLDIVFSFICWYKYAKEVTVTHFITFKFSHQKLWSFSIRNKELWRNRRNEKKSCLCSSENIYGKGRIYDCIIDRKRIRALRKARSNKVGFVTLPSKI